MAKKSSYEFRTLGLDNTYTVVVPAGTLAGPISFGVSGTLSSSAYPVMTPYGGLSSVDVTAFSISASNPTYFGSVSANVSLPATLLSNQPIVFSVVYDNTVTHVDPLTVPFRVAVTTNNASMSADATGGALSGTQTFYSDINSLVATGTKWLLWDSQAEHTRLYQEEGVL
jgi:hypothetical protein